jgi:DNA processing protein
VGCHTLLRGEAHLVTRAEDVIEFIGRIGELAPDEERPTSSLDALSAIDKRVYDALPARGSRTAEEIAVASGLPPAQVLGPLAMLEVAGLVVHAQGRWKLSRIR